MKKPGSCPSLARIFRSRFTLAVLISVSILLNLVSPIFSQSSDELSKKDAEIRALEDKISELRGQAKTLGNQITFMNSQIQVTLLKISQTEDQILALSGKIDRLEVSLNEFSRILENRISQTYKQGYYEPLTILVSSNNISKFFLRYKYVKAAQLHDRKLLSQVVQTQASYSDQKTQEEKLKEKMENQKQLLAQQIKEKQHLLAVTKNDEKKYHALLASAMAEQASMRSAMRIAKLQNGTAINAGDAIALIGNSGSPGCSSGSHLHFEVNKDGEPQDPSKYIKQTSLSWDNQPDPTFSFSGDWSFPVQNPKITQGFGMTYWAKLGWYNGGPHTGIDMVSDDPTIRAPKSGTLYHGSISCKGSTMNYVAVDHGSGIVTWYWHVR